MTDERRWNHPPTAAAKIIRCVYCKVRILSPTQIAAHEAGCPMRETVKSQWARTISVARQREQRRQERLRAAHEQA